MQKKLRTRGSVWKIEKQKYLKEKLVKSQQSCGFWTVLCDLTKKIVRANLLPTWLSCLAWKVRNLPVKTRQMKRCNYLNYSRNQRKNVNSNEEIVCAEAVVINWANFPYVLKKFDDIVLEHCNLTRFWKRVKVDSTGEVVQTFDFIHNFVSFESNMTWNIRNFSLNLKRKSSKKEIWFVELR